ncbi:MAG: polymer-forming cytoskeletal protein [Pseudomonadota bacterium]
MFGFGKSRTHSSAQSHKANGPPAQSEPQEPQPPLIVAAAQVESATLDKHLASTPPLPENSELRSILEQPHDLEVIEVSEDEGRVLIGRGTKLVGEVSNCSQVEVQGHLEGTLVADHVIVSNGGSVNGGLHAGHAEVLGDVEGNVHVEGLLDVHATGRINGNLTYGRLSVADGGDISGEIHGPERGPTPANADQVQAGRTETPPSERPEFYSPASPAATVHRSQDAGRTAGGLNGNSQTRFSSGPRPSSPDGQHAHHAK